MTLTQDEAQGRRTRYSGLLAGAIGCYVLAAIVGMFFLGDDIGLVVQIPLWIVHGALLTAMIRKLGAIDSSAAAALFIVTPSWIPRPSGRGGNESPAEQGRERRIASRAIRHLRPPADSRRLHGS